LLNDLIALKDKIFLRRLLLKSNQTAVAINVMEKFNVITALELL